MKLTAKLVAIVGPTASGKTGLGIQIAKRYGGEIICADSRTVYRGLDIGTAKPTTEERAMAVHWGLDLVDPDQTWTVADFKAYADAKIADITARGKLPILVGGSGLFVDAVVYNFSFRDQSTAERCQELSQMNVDELTTIIKQQGYPLPSNFNNKRHLIRTIETAGQSDQKRPLLPGTVIIGLNPPRAELRLKIQQRIIQMLELGLVNETKRLVGQWGLENQALSANIYQLAWRLLRGEISQQEFVDLSTTKDMQYAKRQMTWWRRHADDVAWFDGAEAAQDVLEKSLE